MSKYEVTVAEFRRFVVASGYKTDGDWRCVVIGQVRPQRENNHPVLNVSWNDATAYCRWLTMTERGAGKLPSGFEYRLPTDVEWSEAVGIGGKETGATPRDKNAKVENVYPWGTQFPPPPGAGNFADLSAKN